MMIASGTKLVANNSASNVTDNRSIKNDFTTNNQKDYVIESNEYYPVFEAPFEGGSRVLVVNENQPSYKNNTNLVIVQK